MTRQLLAVGLLVWAGAALLLSRARGFRRLSLSERLRPFHPGAIAPRTGGSGGRTSVSGSFGELAETAGNAVAGLLGVTERPAVRLARIHSDRSARSFRLRQATWVIASAVAGATVATVAGAPWPLALLLVAGSPTLGFLVLEQRLARASEKWQRQTAQELPVVAEQLAMLLNAGLSLGAALGRVAERGNGCVARDLDAVANRIRQGVSEPDALKEWADRVAIDPVKRLVSVLTLHSDAGDLGRLVSVEAKQARRELHRKTLEAIEKRSEQVWVPVTVATLVPGAILLAVPFLSALRLFSGT